MLIDVAGQALCCHHKCMVTMAYEVCGQLKIEADAEEDDGQRSESDPTTILQQSRGSGAHNKDKGKGYHLVVARLHVVVPAGEEDISAGGQQGCHKNGIVPQGTQQDQRKNDQYSGKHADRFINPQGAVKGVPEGAYPAAYGCWLHPLIHFKKVLIVRKVARAHDQKVVGTPGNAGSGGHNGRISCKGPNLITRCVPQQVKGRGNQKDGCGFGKDLQAKQDADRCKQYVAKRI